MKVYLIDGTYELFRHYFALPSHINDDGDEVAATRGVVRSVLSLLDRGVTHLAVATDHVIESFRNDLWQDYKDGSGIEADLLAQFGPLEDALQALGVVVWAMTDYEADDALAAGAAQTAADDRVEQVLICTPDKDLVQCVRGDRVVQLDRRRDAITDEPGVLEKFGVPPRSIPDFLALVGDAADGYPGIPGFGRKTASALLRRFGSLEAIPESARDWDVNLRGKGRLAATLKEKRDLATLFKRLATLVDDLPLAADVDDLRWNGPEDRFAETARRLDALELAEKADTLTAPTNRP